MLARSHIMPDEYIENMQQGQFPIQTVAAIDIGSNEIRMVVAELFSDGEINVLEKLQRAVPLGQDTFNLGRIKEQTMRIAISILRDYSKLLDFYKINFVRAVATSAIREATNCDTFVDRVFMATNIDVEVLVPSEISRLIVSAVNQSISHAMPQDFSSLVVEVSGGSTLLTEIKKGKILISQTLSLGAVRLPEKLYAVHDSPEKALDIFGHHISNELADLEVNMSLKRKKRKFIAIGGDARFAAEQYGKAIEGSDLMVVSKTRLKKLLSQCQHMTPDALVRKYNLSISSATTLNPALRIYYALLETTGLKEMIVSPVSMRDGLLQDIKQKVFDEEDPSLLSGTLQSAMTLAKKYHCDLNHVRQVSEKSIIIFDELQSIHGLNARHRHLLEVACILHEVGGFIDSRAHHKHSYYIISNSEIFGLTRTELAVVAHVARYHRRGVPKNTHRDYVMLPRSLRTVVNKLAAILRVADALCVAHSDKSFNFRCEIKDDEIIIFVLGAKDLTMERQSVSLKGNLFEETFGMKVRLEEVDTPLSFNQSYASDV